MLEEVKKVMDRRGLKVHFDRSSIILCEIFESSCTANLYVLMFFASMFIACLGQSWS